MSDRLKTGGCSLLFCCNTWCLGYCCDWRSFHLSVLWFSVEGTSAWGKDCFARS